MESVQITKADMVQKAQCGSRKRIGCVSTDHECWHSEKGRQKMVISFVDARDTESKPVFRCFADRPLVGGRLHPDDVEILDSLAKFWMQRLGYGIKWIWCR